MGPVIQRELRLEARRPATRRLRLFSAIAACVVLAWQILSRVPGDPMQGVNLFVTLHLVTCVIIWVFVPLMTADCISREKREGTLGLLFLTPLTGSGIVFGKGLVQALRGMTIWWAALPALAIPFVVGGVQAADVLMALVIQGGSLLLTLPIGLMASSCCRRRLHAMVLAALLAATCLYVVGWFSGQLDVRLLRIYNHDPGMLWGLRKLGGGWLMFEFTAGWGVLTPREAAALGEHWRQALLVCVLAGAAFTVAVPALAGFRLQRTWQDRPSTMRAERRQRFWFEPRLLRNCLAWSRRRLLEHNPIGWLQHYTAQDRALKWGLCLAVLLVEFLLMLKFNGRRHDFAVTQHVVAVLLCVMLAFSAANSFQREFETGALELILVTPVREQKLINGRLYGIWWHFAPALIPLLGVWLFCWEPELQLYGFGLLAAFLLQPMVGFCLSLKLRNFFVVWPLCAAVGLLSLLPGFWQSLLMAFGLGSFVPVRRGDESDFYALWAGIVMEILCCLMAWTQLRHDLVDRRFVLKSIE